MIVEPIGFFTVILCFLCIVSSAEFTIYTFAVLCLLNAAAALFLGSGGQVQPAHLLLAAVVPAVLCKRRALAAALQSLVYPQPGFWLAFIALFGVVGAVTLPRIFAGATQINAIGQSEAGASLMLTPLSPVGGNVTQTIYLVADLFCFLTVVGAGSIRGGAATLAKAMIAYAAFNIVFGVLDLVTYYTGTTALLGPIRNAQYTLHLDEESSGLKRIAGSFTETASFSTATLGSLGFTGTLWLFGRWTAWTGTLSLASIALLVLSTSSTAVVGGPALLGILYYTAVRRVSGGRRSRVAGFVVLSAPVAVLIIVGVLALSSDAANTITGYLNALVFDKAMSQSGLERASWNAAALQNFFDTDGLGAGLGSVRASSFLVAVPANLGLPGVVCFSAFLWQTLACARVWGNPQADLHIAARNGCLGLLIAASISGALVDLGLQFYFLAGLSSVCALSRDIKTHAGMASMSGPPSQLTGLG